MNDSNSDFEIRYAGTSPSRRAITQAFVVVCTILTMILTGCESLSERYKKEPRTTVADPSRSDPTQDGSNTDRSMNTVAAEDATASDIESAASTPTARDIIERVASDTALANFGETRYEEYEKEDLLGWQHRVYAIQMIGTGQWLVARKHLLWARAIETNPAFAEYLLDQLHSDPVDYLGPENHVYTVGPADTLSSLAEQVLGDKLKFPILARYNGITVPNALEVGTEILLPGVPIARTQSPQTVPQAEADALGDAPENQARVDGENRNEQVVETVESDAATPIARTYSPLRGPKVQTNAPDDATKNKAQIDSENQNEQFVDSVEPDAAIPTEPVDTATPTAPVTDTTNPGVATAADGTADSMRELEIRAERHYQSGEFGKARKVIDEILRIDSGNLAAQLMRRRLLDVQ